MLRERGTNFKFMLYAPGRKMRPRIDGAKKMKRTEHATYK